MRAYGHNSMPLLVAPVHRVTQGPTVNGQRESVGSATANLPITSEVSLGLSLALRSPRSINLHSWSRALNSSTNTLAPLSSDSSTSIPGRLLGGQSDSPATCSSVLPISVGQIPHNHEGLCGLIIYLQ